MPPQILDPGIEFLRYLSQFRGPLANAVFLGLSGLGSTAGYVVLFCLLWWGVSSRLGTKLFVALVLSVYLNAVLKDWVGQPRPFVYADIDSVTRPGEFSFPSGHAQHAALVWTLLAAHFRKRWFTIVAFAMAVLVGFSRLYLGVHFPTDVLAGWLMGGILAAACLRWSGRSIDWASRLAFERQILLSLLVPLALVLLHETANTAIALGGLAGALSGLTLARRDRLDPEDRPGPRRPERLVLGLVGLPVVYLALSGLSLSEGSPLYPLHLWLQFAAIGLWVSFLVPKLVSRMRAREGPS